MVNNNCYTRDSERSIAELASNLEQILTFGAIEAIIDFLALIFDCCSMKLGGFEDTLGIVAFAVHGVSIFFDIILSAVNFFGYVIPAFDTYNKQDDLESRCYSFTYGFDSNSNVSAIIPASDAFGYSTTIIHDGDASNDELSLGYILLIVFGSCTACGCVCLCVAWFFGTIFGFIDDIDEDDEDDFSGYLVAAGCIQLLGCCCCCCCLCFVIAACVMFIPWAVFSWLISWIFKQI